MCVHVRIDPQDLERQNETLQESLRKYHQEQRTLTDKVNLLQQQLSQVHNTTMQQQCAHRSPASSFFIACVFNLAEKSQIEPDYVSLIKVSSSSSSTTSYFFLGYK